jgi:hypothetical protein
MYRVNAHTFLPMWAFQIFISLQLPSRFEIFEANRLKEVKNQEGLCSGTCRYAKVWPIFLVFEMTNKKTHETFKIRTWPLEFGKFQ